MGTASSDLGILCHVSWIPVLKHIYKLTCLERVLWSAEKKPPVNTGFFLPSCVRYLASGWLQVSFMFFSFLSSRLAKTSFNKQRAAQKRVFLSCASHLWGSGPQPSRQARFDRASPLQAQLLIYLSRHRLRQSPRGLLLPQLSGFV